MSDPHEVLAVVFDFDDTLVPDSTTKLLKDHGVDTERFWTVEAKALVNSGYDPALAYLKLILDRTSPGQPLSGLTNSRLREFGRSLDRTYYRGIPKVFKDLKKAVAEYKGIEIEFYIISGGLQQVVLGSKVVEEFFHGVYGCQLGGDGEAGPLKYIKRCVTFTEKTRYLFEINKGLQQKATASNPFLVNKNVDAKSRRIPFKNIMA